MVICDDDDGILEVTKLFLELEGYRVVTLKNCTGFFDCLIVPRKDGLKAVNTFVANSQGKPLSSGGVNAWADQLQRMSRVVGERRHRAHHRHRPNRVDRVDAIGTIGIFVLLGKEINLTTIAAAITIVGYSVNDTVVVFDRIRENLAKPRHGRTFMEILNRAVNETLPRTVLTASGTLATLVSLLLFGGPVIRDFALVLILGIAIGTFSSIFIASPVLYLIERRWPHKTLKPQQAAPSHSNRQRAARSTV